MATGDNMKRLCGHPVTQGIVVVLMSLIAVSISTAQTVQAPGTPQLPLIRDGNAMSVIVLALEAAPDEQLAARELQAYLQKISGARVEMRTVAPAAIASTAQQ